MKGAAVPRLRQLLAFGPYRGELTVALRAGISVAIPLLILWGIGRIDLSLFSTFGAFAALFGRTVPIRPRLIPQAQAGLTQLIMVLVGVAVAIFPFRGWLAVPVAATAAVLVAIIAHRCHWHPPGPLFALFALGACSSVPSVPGDLWLAALIAGAAVIISLSVTVLAALSGRMLARIRGRAPHEVQPAVHPPVALTEWPLRHYLVRYGVGVAVAGAIATALPVIGHPYWAMVTVVAPMAAPGVAAQLLRATHRLIGTLVGVLIAWSILIFQPSPLAAIIIAVLLQIGAEMFVGRNYGVAFLFITPLALIMVQLAHPIPVAELVRDRALETLLGVIIAIVITILTHERRQDVDG